MEIESRLASWVSDLRYEDLPDAAIDQMKTLVRTILGTTVAGATSDGCEAIVEQTRQWGGAEESTILLYGGKVPAHSAALANSTMARALDICDGSDPGVHIGASLVPVALASAELAGGCTGEELIASLAAGTELSARLALVAVYDGFDPSGVAPVFGAAAVAGRILGLDRDAMLHALALAFNRAGGSFQCNIDGALAVRVIQGFVSQNGVICAQLAQRGITGPHNFVEGSFGYYHLYAKDQRDEAMLVDDLGSRWSMYGMGFKAYPSCGATLASTDAMLAVVRDQGLEPDDVDAVEIRVTRPVFALVGHAFDPGANPTVSGQFNIRYCVANALLRRGSRLADFTREAVLDPRIAEIVERIEVTLDPDLDEGKRELGARVAMRVARRDGGVIETALDGPPGFPPRQLTPEQHLERFWDNVAFGGLPLTAETLDEIVQTCAELDRVDDARSVIPLMVSEAVATAAAR